MFHDDQNTLSKKKGHFNRAVNYMKDEYAFYCFHYSTATTSTAGAAAAAAGPKMSYQELEHAINKWTVELEEQEKIFLKQATQVNAWDRLLIENGEKVYVQCSTVWCSPGFRKWSLCMHGTGS